MVCNRHIIIIMYKKYNRSKKNLSTEIQKIYMEDSNTALLAAKLHHTSHMIKKFSHQAIHITRMKSLSDS